MEAVKKSKTVTRKKIKPPEPLEVFPQPTGFEDSKLFPLLELLKTELNENENGNSISCTPPATSTTNIETEQSEGNLPSSFSRDTLRTPELQNPTVWYPTPKSDIFPTTSTNEVRAKKKVEEVNEGYQENDPSELISVKATSPKPLTEGPLVDTEVPIREESSVLHPLPVLTAQEKLGYKKGWQKFAAKFRRSKEKRKVEDFVAVASPHASKKPSKSSTLDSLARQAIRFHHNPQQPHFENVKRKCSTLPVCPAPALIPFEDLFEGEEYSRTYLRELFNSMDNFLETVFSSGPSSLRFYYSMLPQNSQVVHRISEASKDLRTFRFFLWNLLGTPYGETRSSHPPTYKISGMEDFVRSILAKIEIAVRESLGELYRYDVPVVVRTRLASGLEKIKGTLAQKDPPNLPVDCGHLAGFAYPRDQPMLTRYRSSNVLEDSNRPEIHENKNSQILGRSLVPEVPDFKGPRILKSLEPNVKKSFQSLSKFNASEDNGNESNMDRLEKEVSVKKTKEYVPLLHSWDELMKLIAGEDSSSKDASNDITSKPQPTTTGKMTTIPKARSVARNQPNNAVEHQDVEEGALIPPSCRHHRRRHHKHSSVEETNTVEHQEVEEGAILPPSFRHRRRSRHKHRRPRPIGQSQTPKPPRHLSFPVNAESLRNRLQSDAMLSIFPSTKTSSTPEELAVFQGTNKVQPSTTLENLSAEMRGWARRKSQKLTEAKNRFIKLFKKN